MELESGGMTGPANQLDRVRDGEKPRTWYRSERIYHSRQGWYFHTREGIEVGPYTCRFDAEMDLEVLVKALAADPKSALQKIHAQTVSAQTGDYMQSSTCYTDYVVEEGGVELLRTGS